jgi:hypothetical protein
LYNVDHGGVGVMVISATFNNFTYIVAVSFLGGENYRSVVSQWQTLLHNVVSSTHRLTGINMA